MAHQGALCTVERVTCAFRVEPHNHRPGTCRVCLAPTLMTAFYILIRQGRMHRHLLIDDLQHLGMSILASDRVRYLALQLYCSVSSTLTLSLLTLICNSSILLSLASMVSFWWDVFIVCILSTRVYGYMADLNFFYHIFFSEKFQNSQSKHGLFQNSQSKHGMLRVVCLCGVH